MSDKTLEDKAVEILDASQQALGTFADKMAELAKQYGPDVAAAALQMARIDAAEKLIYGVLMLVAYGIVLLICRRVYKAHLSPECEPMKREIAWKMYYEAYMDRPTRPSFPRPDLDVHKAIVHVGVVVGTGLLLLPALFMLANVWRWVGIFEPKLWLAKRILGL